MRTYRRRLILERLADQSGVAMATVLFVAAALTAVASAAAFSAFNDLSSNLDDRKAAESLAYAEAGIDRLVLELKRNGFQLGDIRVSGCTGYGGVDASGRPVVRMAGEVGNGQFDVQLTVWPYPADPAECAARSTDKLRDPRLFAITSTGSHPTAKRVIRLIVRIRARGLPFAVYANTVTGTGTPKLSDVSLLTPGDVQHRQSIGFRGVDPYYKLGDFWPGHPDADQQVPAAIHAGGTIQCDSPQCGAQNPVEHLPTNTLNCVANRDTGGGGSAGTTGQSLWDQSGGGGTIASIPAGSRCQDWYSITGLTNLDPPPTSSYSPEELAVLVPEPNLTDEEYLTLRDVARESGVYCSIDAVGGKSCRRAGDPYVFSGGGTFGISVGNADLTTTPPLPNNFVAYFEYEDPARRKTDNEVTWSAHWPPDGSVCNASAPPDQLRSVILIVRNGSLRAAANTRVNGAMFLPEGRLTDAGGFVWNGSIIADEFNRAGQSTYQLNDCWFANAPLPFMTVVPVRWQEVDR